MDKQRILVVDDEPELRQMLRRYLEAEGFEVAEAIDGDKALSMIRSSPPDLMVLDVGLPGTDGFTVLQETRRLSDTPVIMLTARTEEVDRVIGLTIGADDYIAKPFSPRELVARIRAVLRRGARSRAETGERIEFEGITLDLAGRRVSVDGRDVELSALEFDLLTALTSAPGRVFTRAQLLERVWGWAYFGPERVVDVHIGNIRKVLGDDASDPRFIGTVRGVGYRLVATPR
ncbi:MAG TPA: response regulator transcription factor [Acidimicrobiia bacterium]|nr:response regulator transcription factor [Acidimicrobiia bacterium]